MGVRLALEPAALGVRGANRHRIPGMSADTPPDRPQGTSRLPLWRILVCLGCLAVCVGIVITSPKPATHKPNVLQLFETIGNAGPLRQILMALFFCLAVGATITPNGTKAP